MTELDATERYCLDYLTDHPDAELAQFDRVVIQRLLDKTLIEQIPLMMLPGMPAQIRYRITGQGRAALDRFWRGG